MGRRKSHLLSKSNYLWNNQLVMLLSIKSCGIICTALASVPGIVAWMRKICIAFGSKVQSCMKAHKVQQPGKVAKK